MLERVHKIVRSSFFTSVSFMAHVIVTLFLMPFIIHSLGDRMYGLWSLVGVFIGYYGMLDFGLSVAVDKHMATALGARDEEKTGVIFNTALASYACIGFIVLVISMALAASTGLFVENAGEARLFGWVLLVMGISIAVDFPVKAFTGLLNARIRLDIVSTISIFTLFIRSVLIVAVLATGHKILALALVTVLAGLPEKLLIVYFARRELPSLRFRKKFLDFPQARQLFSFSLYTFAARLSDQLRFHVDFLVITMFIGLATVTHYKIGSTMVLYFRSLVVTVLMVFFPHFSQLEGAGDYDKLRERYFFSTKLAMGLSCFLGFSLIAWGDNFIPLWVGREYLDAYPVLLVLVVCSTIDLFQAPASALVIATSNHRLFAVYGVAEGVLNLLISLLLVRKYGMLGVAFGTFIPMLLVRGIVQPIHVCKVMSISLREYLRRIGKTLVVVVAALALPGLFAKYVGADNVPSIIALGIVTLSFYAVLFWYFEFSSSERGLIGRALRMGHTYK